jgi:hypothetical protein
MKKLSSTIKIGIWQKFLFLLLLLISIPALEGMAQATISDEERAPLVAYDDIPVRVMVEGYKMFYIDAIYGTNKLLYVNVEDLFNTLSIPCIPAKNGNNITGFIETESRNYSINFETKQIIIGNKTINCKNGLVKEMDALYMESSLFAEAFGITLTFNYRALTIILKSDFELPIFKQLRIEKLRTNISKIKGEVVADTIIKRDYHFAKFGSVDWAAASYQTWNGPTNHQLSLGVGTELLGGEANASVNYYSQYKFDNRQLNYLWRWIDNDQSFIKQAQVGKISNQTISFINAPVVGATVRNTPTTIRKASGYYTINEYTEPNWSVELYINNVMVDYTKSDASGLYSFKVPIVYGYTTLKLKFYGPLGEERTDERTMNVPYTIMPAGEFEYGVSGGVLEDTLSSRFGKAEFNYGVNRILTVGGGMEYLSSIANSPYIPYAKITLQPFSKMTINGEYAYGVRARGLLNFYFRRDALLVIDYSKYAEGQHATLFNAPEERKIKLSIPLRVKKLAGFARLDYTQMVYKSFNYNQANMMLSAYYQQFSTNSATMINWLGNLSSYATTDLALSYRTKTGYTIRPSAQYNIGDGKLINCKMTVEKYIPRGNFSVSYERNVLYSDNFINVNFKYDLPFARTNLSVSRSGGNTITSESIQGSLAFGGGNGYVHTSNNSSVSKGGLLLYPFLDLNNNGKFDRGEHMVKITNVSIMGGKVLFNDKDSIVRIPDLNAFTNYLVEFQDNDLENIAWRFKKKVYQVMIDPNQFKRINIPVVPVGEVSGMAYLNKDNILKGLRRILIKFYRRDNDKLIAKTLSEADAFSASRLVAQTLSESDGYIYYIGLEPGEYYARVDAEQLRNLKMVSSPEVIPIKIEQTVNGDIVSGMDFILSPAVEIAPEDSVMVVTADLVAKTSEVKSEPAVSSAVTPENVKHISAVLKNYKNSVIEYEGDVIQVGAYKNRANAYAIRKKLWDRMAVPSVVILEDSYYKVLITGFANRGLARASAMRLPKSDFPDLYVPVIKPNASIQIGEYQKENEAVAAQQEWVQFTKKQVIILFENGLFKLRIPGFANRTIATKYAAEMGKSIIR